VREAGFDQGYLFKFSPRRDTPAAGMPGALPATVIEERHARLLRVLNETASSRYDCLVGQTVQVLVEGPSRKNPARLEGRTRCHKIVVFEGGSRHVGQLLDLKVVRTGSFTLYGDPAILPTD
jgi:tRNA-2-methylthio-N6-dimethylallyladenosine synthase